MDLLIAKFFNQLGQGTFIDDLSIIISYNIFFIAIFLLFGAWFLFREKITFKKYVIAIFIAVGLQYAISDGFFKFVIPEYLGIERERPYIAHPQEIIPIGEQNTSASFPSNHSSSVAAVLGVVAYFYRKSWKWVAVFIILTALSRMHNGMHYPTDVIGGTILGLLYSWLAVWLSERYFVKINSLIDRILRIFKLNK